MCELLENLKTEQSCEIFIKNCPEAILIIDTATGQIFDAKLAAIK